MAKSCIGDLRGACCVYCTASAGAELRDVGCCACRYWGLFWRSRKHYIGHRERCVEGREGEEFRHVVVYLVSAWGTEYRAFVRQPRG